jgi:uncharacterized HhH-GPD family protein
MTTVTKTPFTGNDAADQLLSDNPFALLVGMLLDQQVPMEWAFGAPAMLRDRLGGDLDPADVAAMDPEKLKEVFAERPALHRYPGSMAGRVHTLAQAVVDDYGGDAAAVWSTAATGDELLRRLTSLPGFGDQKARIFLAVLAKRLGVTPPGWEAAAGLYGNPGYYSVADVDGAAALEKVRAYKKDVKAKAKQAKAAAS